MKENIRYYSLSMSIHEIINLIKVNEIELDTSVYRNLIWSAQKQSLFIDSLYNNFPTPNIFLYVDESKQQRYSVIDGIQRLKTIHMFFNNDFKINLKGSPIHNLYFEDFSSSERRRLLNSPIPITVVEDMWNDDKVMEEIFYRLNLGGTDLTHQEFRNRMYSGEMIDKINSLNTNELWREFYNKRIDPRYKDSEEILKFFTVVSEGKVNSNSLKEQMDKFIDLNRNNENLANNLSEIFIKSLHIIYDEFGAEAFLKNKRFNQKLYMTLFIPLGILLSKGEYSFNFNGFRNMFFNYKNQKNLKIPNQKAVRIGMEMLVGDKYE